MASTVLSVSWKDHSGALTEVCKTLLDSNFLVDCTIAAEGKALKAHRLILSACSPYFQMLFGDDCEKHPIVILQDASFETLKAMVDFIYHGETQVSEERLEAFLTLAETLQIKGLNDTSKKNRRKPQSDDSTRETRHRPPSEDRKDTCEVQISSVSHEPSPEDSLQQQHSFHSEEYPDVAQNCSVSLEGNNSSYELVKQTSVIQSSQQQLPPMPDHVSSEEQNVKSEPLHHVFLVPKHEQMDEDESDEPTQDVSEIDINEEPVPTFEEKHLNQYSNAPSCSESVNMLPSAYAMPQMAGPPDVQGERGPPPPPQQQQQQQQELVTHMKCSERGATFDTAQNLARHVTLRRGGLPNVCDVCGKTFARGDHLVAHARVHTGQRPFSCDICGLSFSQTGNLARHRRSHTGERPYPCDVCGRAFISSSHLSSHRRTHTGERPYRCDVCGLTFARPRTLTTHKLKHTKQSP